MKIFALAVVVVAAVAAKASAQAQLPQCSESPTNGAKAGPCLCNGQVRQGGEAGDCRPDAPTPRSGAARNGNRAQFQQRLNGLSEQAQKDGVFGLKGVGVTAGTITGADGSGPGGGVSVQFMRTHPHKWGYLTANANVPSIYHMRGITVNNVDQIPGDPTDPANPPLQVNTTVRSPKVDYLPVAEVDYHPHDFFHGRVSPEVGGQFGATMLESTNARVTGGTVYANMGGQLIPVDSVPASLQPTGEKKWHPGGGVVGGADIRITRGFSVEPKVVYAPTGYTTKTVTLWWHSKPKGDK